MSRAPVQGWCSTIRRRAPGAASAGSTRAPNRPNHKGYATGSASSTTQGPATMAELVVHSWRRALCSPDHKLSSTARLVGLALSLDGDTNGTNCRPGAGKLAKQCNLSVSATRSALALLVDTGWLKRVSRGGQAGQARAAAVYHLTFPHRTGTTTGSTDRSVAQEAGNPTGTTTPLGTGTDNSSTDASTGPPGDPAINPVAVLEEARRRLHGERPAVVTG
jgi:hypothetical protein